MDSRTIETLSVNAVKDSIARCEYLGPYISDNDREPSWDGYIYVYKDNSSKKKDNIEGRIPVQVKGKVIDELDKDTIKYSVDTIDLRNYLHDGGALYFVVAISSDGEKRTIYYTALAPVKIEMILKRNPDQKSVTLEFSRFPKDNNKKATICMNLLEHNRKQSSFIGIELKAPEELLSNAAEIERLEIPLIHVGDKDKREETLLNTETYLYLRRKGDVIPQPLMVELKKAFLQREEKACISVNGKQFYEKVNHYRDADGDTYVIGNSIYITCPPNSNENKVSIDLSPMLRERVKDLRFIDEITKSKGFCINNDFHPLDIYEISSDVEKARRKTRKYHERILELLEKMKVSADLNMANLSKEECQLLAVLFEAVLNEKSVPGIRITKPQKVCFKIGAISLLFWVVPNMVNNERVFLFDYFAYDGEVTIDGEEGQLTMSHFITLDLDDIVSSDNFRMDNIIPFLKKHIENEQAYIYANNIFLFFLLASDKVKEKRLQYAEYAVQMAEWLQTTPENVIASRISYVNKLQAIKRIRFLKDEEKNRLKKMIEEFSSDNCFLFCAYLLLDDKQKAEQILSKYDKEQQKQFRALPINYFISA